MIVIGNIPSDGIDMKYVFLNEFQSKITTRAALDIGRLQLLEDADFLEGSTMDSKPIACRH